MFWRGFPYIEVGCDPSSTVCILSPADRGRQLPNVFFICIGGPGKNYNWYLQAFHLIPIFSTFHSGFYLYSRWETRGPDVLAEGDLLWQMDESNVGIEAVWVPLRVGLALEGGDLDPVRLRTGANIVSSGCMRSRLVLWLGQLLDICWFYP